MKIYIASSWKNVHAVQMLTALLRYRGHTVLSFVENDNSEDNSSQVKTLNFNSWVWSKFGLKSFDFDTNGAMKSDLVIYISPSGTDAWAEVGAAYARNVLIFGLNSKGEQAGLMRRMVSSWFDSYTELLTAVDGIIIN